MQKSWLSCFEVDEFLTTLELLLLSVNTAALRLRMSSFSRVE
jgi:hypothetical protein